MLGTSGEPYPFPHLAYCSSLSDCASAFCLCSSRSCARSLLRPDLSRKTVSECRDSSGGGRCLKSHVLEHFAISRQFSDYDSFQHSFLLLVRSSERAYHPTPGRITALAFSCCPAQPHSYHDPLNISLLLQTCSWGRWREKKIISHSPHDFTGIALKSLFINLLFPRLSDPTQGIHSHA